MSGPSQVPASLKPHFKKVTLANNPYSIQVGWEFNDGAVPRSPSTDIDEPATSHPDCEVGY